jgi:catechol 2,3-dioxygenase-like lactoylglutathione lyase family enzyme
MAVVGAHHTSYTVSDLNKTLPFYRDLMGFEVVHERPEIVLEYWRAVVGFPDAVARDAVLRIPGTTHFLELIEYKNPRGVAQNVMPNNPGSSHVCYLVDDLQAMHARLKEAGVQFISKEPIYLDQGPNKGGWSLYMKDPDGIVIELFQRAR